MKKLVALTGAGISAESGIRTFRDSNGLWEDHRVEDVASPEGFRRDPKLVLDFYNARRRQLLEVAPNDGHRALVELEKHFDVSIITQNVDDLHERAGSKNVFHLHGELLSVRSTVYSDLKYRWEKDLVLGDRCEKGAQLRPDIVWFGEAVPMMESASELAEDADVFLVVGTSLQVYPAAGLMGYCRRDVPIFLIDPSLQVNQELKRMPFLTVISEAASTGVWTLFEKLGLKK